LGRKLEECLHRILGTKMEGLVTEFKKEIIPEIQAATEEMRQRLDREEKEQLLSAGDVADDGVAAGRLTESQLDAMRTELEALRKEKDLHDGHLKNAATTKVHELVKLQNLLDHMRADNRTLQTQLNRYRERFVEIKEAQRSNVVDKLWGLWQQKPRSHLST